MGKYSGARACMRRLDRGRGRNLLRMCHTELPVAVNPAVWKEPLMRVGLYTPGYEVYENLSRFLAELYRTVLGLRESILGKN